MSVVHFEVRPCHVCGKDVEVALAEESYKDDEDIWCHDCFFDDVETRIAENYAQWCEQQGD